MRPAIRALGTARQRLDQANLAYSAHVLVGEAAPTLVEFSKSKHCDMIIMGAHGFGTVLGLFMGSVTVKVVQIAHRSGVADQVTQNLSS